MILDYIYRITKSVKGVTILKKYFTTFKEGTYVL